MASTAAGIHTFVVKVEDLLFLHKVEHHESDLINEYDEMEADFLGDFLVTGSAQSEREPKSLGLGARHAKVARSTGKALKETRSSARYSGRSWGGRAQSKC